jgi:hypothetical protein
MRLRPLSLALALLAGAAVLARAAVTRDGVGVVEYITVIAMIALLLRSSYHLSRRAFR